MPKHQHFAEGGGAVVAGELPVGPSADRRCAKIAVGLRLPVIDQRLRPVARAIEEQGERRDDWGTESISSTNGPFGKAFSTSTFYLEPARR